MKLNDRTYLSAIYPLIIMVGNPLGTFYFTIMNGAIQIYQSSFTSSDLKLSLNTTDNNLYVYYPILTNIKLRKGNYTLKLTASGYSESPSSFIGWGQQHEDIQNSMDYIPSGISKNSLTYRVKMLKEGIYD